MRLLLSAYACEPGRGSEPEVGWSWALESARQGHDVWVITRTNNKTKIETWLLQNPLPNLHFIYWDLPAWARFWKRGLHGVHLYYFLWQIGAFFTAWYYHRKIKFERVHHVTFVSIRQPSFMGLLGIPFIFGPVAGGEKAPYRLRAGYPIHGWIKDALRDVLNALIWVDPFMHLTFLTSQAIYVTSQDTQKLLPPIYQKKSSIHLAIGIQENLIAEAPHQKGKGLQILYVGNLLYLKGIHLALQAFVNLIQDNADAHLTLIGSGPDANWLQAKTKALGLESHVTWIPYMPREELLKCYQKYDTLLFPSLHDSGGITVLEALAQGLPVTCLDLGGPGHIVNDACGFVIPTTKSDESFIIRQLASALQQLTDCSPGKWETLSKSSLQRARDFVWAKTIRELLLQ
jgi:glycosyltransferase involved in cell wall biosynthesis